MKEKRTQLSKKIRFDVFKRDFFACQYCGNTPPAVILEVDHVHPVSKGGDNDIDNLVTSCFDCNRGKSAELLEIIPTALIDKTKLLQEKEEQLKAYKRLLTRKKHRENIDIDDIQEIFNLYYPDSYFTESFRLSIRLSFLQELDPLTIHDAMRMACERTNTADGASKYFCGVCWNKIKGIVPTRRGKHG